MFLKQVRKGAVIVWIPVRIVKSKQLFLSFLWFKQFFKFVFHRYKLNLNVSLFSRDFQMYGLFGRYRIFKNLLKIPKTNFDDTFIAALKQKVRWKARSVDFKNPLIQKKLLYRRLNLSKVNIHFRW
jgi:hypothetical protein